MLSEICPNPYNNTTSRVNTHVMSEYSLHEYSLTKSEYSCVNADSSILTNVLWWGMVIMGDDR